MMHRFPRTIITPMRSVNITSFPRKRESSAARLRGMTIQAHGAEPTSAESHARYCSRWIPAFAGMTLVFAFFLLFLTSQASASTKDTPPDPATNPALAALMKSGAKFFYMGRNAGLDGWLAVKDGQIQIVYKPTNNAYVLVGYMFGPNGDNVTSTQVKQLTATNKELAQLASVETPNDLPTSDTPLDVAFPKESPAVEALLKQDTLNTSLSVGERLVKVLDKAPSVTLGTNNKAPQIYVIAMPDCPNCKKFWQGFHDPVQKGTVQLRLFPVAPRESDYEREAAQLFKSADVIAAWDKFTSSGKDGLSGNTDLSALEEVRTNTAVGAAWHVSAVPYLLYRGKDGSIKVVQGAPDNPQAVIDDLAPLKPEAVKP